LSALGSIAQKKRRRMRTVRRGEEEALTPDTAERPA
jgi:hypothetical protein